MYIVEYTRERKLTCLELDNLYIMEDSFTDLAFTNWRKITNIENDDFFLSKGILCMAVRGHMVPFFSNGVTNGKKLLEDVDIRWISLKGLAETLLNEYASLLGMMYEHHSIIEKYRTLLFLLIDIDTLLTLARSLPILNEINKLMKMAQSRAI